MISTWSTTPMRRSIGVTRTRRRSGWLEGRHMAGIGFALERLYRSSSIADRMASFAHASVVAAGPCLLSVLCIWLISSFNNELEGRTTIAEFRALVIYSFALSFVVTSPIALVSARLVSDRLHDRDVGAI